MALYGGSGSAFRNHEGLRQLDHPGSWLTASDPLNSRWQVSALFEISRTVESPKLPIPLKAGVKVSYVVNVYADRRPDRYFRLGTSRRVRAQIRRAPSVTTPTPFVRNTIITVDGARRAHRIRAFRRRPVAVTRSTAAPIITQRPRPVITGPPATRRAIRYRAFQHNRRIIRRSTVAAPPARSPITSRAAAVRRAIRLRAFSHDRPRITRSIITSPRPRAPIVTTSEASRTRAFRRRRAHLTLRAATGPPPQPYVRAKIVIGRAGVRASIRTRGFAPRGAHLNRAVPTPTPTPLVRPRIMLGRGRGKAARIRAFSPRQRQHVQRPPVAAPAIVARPRAPIVSRNTGRAARARLHLQGRATITRPASQTPPAQRPRAPIVSDNSQRANRVRTHAQRGATITRAGVQPVRGRPPIITHTARAPTRARLRRRDPIIVRPQPIRSTVRATPTLVSRNGRRRAHLVRAYYQRHPARLQTTRRLGSAAVPTVEATLLLRDFTATDLTINDKTAAQLALRTFTTGTEATATLRDFTTVVLTLRHFTSTELELADHTG